MMQVLLITWLLWIRQVPFCCTQLILGVDKTKTAKSHCYCQIKGFKRHVEAFTYYEENLMVLDHLYIFESCQNLHNHFKSYHVSL